MVRPTQSGTARALPDEDSVDGSDTGDGGIDFSTGGSDVDGGGSATDTDTVQFVTSSSDATTWPTGTAGELDLSQGTWWYITLTGNLTFTITNPPAATIGTVVVLDLVQGSAGSYTVTWPATVFWQNTDGTEGGSAPTLSTAVGARDVILLTGVDGGVSWGGSFSSGATSSSSNTAAQSHILLSDTRATPFAFSDMLQQDDGSDFSWSDP